MFGVTVNKTPWCSSDAVLPEGFFTLRNAGVMHCEHESMVIAEQMRRLLTEANIADVAIVEGACEECAKFRTRPVEVVDIEFDQIEIPIK